MSRWTITILGDTADNPEKLARKLRRVARAAAAKAIDLGLDVDGAVTGGGAPSAEAVEKERGSRNR